MPPRSNRREGACAGRAQLNSIERAQFLQAFLSQRAEVSAQFLSEPHCGAAMLAGLRGLGATVQYLDEPSGYALVEIARDKILDTLDTAGIAYVYTRDDDPTNHQDSVAQIAQSERRAAAVPQIAIPYPRVAATSANEGPYFASDEIGLAELWKEHPKADGRGVRVGVPDEGFDLLHPELQYARDIEGAIVPKVADLGTLTSPDGDSSWVRFGEPIQTIGGIFQAADRTWTVPKDGIYRFGIFDQDLVRGPEDNSHTTKISLSVGVLWDPRRNVVWVDTDGDGNFGNQRALGDYGETHDIDWVGTNDREQDNRIPFAIKIDVARNAAYIRIGGEHGTFVGGPLAGNKLTGGLFEGAAPSVQLVDESVRQGTLIAAVVQMFARSDVDVVNRSGGIGRIGQSNDNRHPLGFEDFEQRVVERAMALYNKPFATYSAAIGTIQVNNYAGAEMLRRNRRLGPPYKDTINSFVWDLPGGLVNTVLAPSANLETDSRYQPQDLLGLDGRRYWGNDRLNPPAPDGYVIGANNSPAIAVVSGLLADLISEAKREHIRYNAARLNNAVFTGTRLLDRFPLSQQGYGLINVAQSWDQLAKMGNADDPDNPELTSFTVSRMDDGHSIEVQGFHADLAKPGEKLEGEIWITRHGGYADGRKYTLSLRGNDGTYTLLDHLTILARDQPVRVRFRTNGASGWKIVFLELRDTKANVVMEDVPLSVRVPDVPDRVAPGVDQYESTIPPLRRESRFVRLDEEVEAARYLMKIPYTGPDNISTRGFPGGRYRDTTAPPGEPVDAAHHVGPMETLESLVTNAEPGTQEVFWENRGRPEYATQYDGPAPDVPIHAELTVTKYAVGIEHDGGALMVTNKLAAVDGRVEFYDATLKTQSLTGAGLHAMGVIERMLPDHLAEWRLRTTLSARLDGPADVYVFDCTGKNGCYVAAQQEVLEAGKALVIEHPAAGAWKIAVRSRNQVQKPVTYTVREATLVPAATPIEAADTGHPNGAFWTLPLPKSQSNAQYAAFRVAGTPGDDREKNGLVIAMTPLEADAP